MRAGLNTSGQTGSGFAVAELAQIVPPPAVRGAVCLQPAAVVPAAGVAIRCAGRTVTRGGRVGNPHSVQRGPRDR